MQSDLETLGIIGWELGVSKVQPVMVQDNPPNDGGGIPKSQGRSWQFNSRLWNLLSTQHKTCQMVNCLVCFGVGLSTFCLKLEWIKIKIKIQLVTCCDLLVLTILIWGIFHQLLQKRSVMYPKSWWPSTGCFLKLNCFICNEQLGHWYAACWRLLGTLIPCPWPHHISYSCSLPTFLHFCISRSRARSNGWLNGKRDARWFS